MRRTLVRWTSILFLLVTSHTLQVACSSSSEETGAEVAAEGGDNANAAPEGEEGNASNQNGGDSESANAGAQGDAAEGNTAENNSGAETNNTGLNQGNDGTNAVANDASKDPAAAGSGGEEDLQQIIQEMNNSTGGQQATAQGAGQGFENLAPANQDANQPAPNAAANVGAGDTATNALAANAATEPAAPTPTTADSGTAMMSGKPAGPGLPEMGSKMSYIVQKGDTLAKIAQRIYGDSNKWTDIANFSGLANPRLIYPGDIVYYQLTDKTSAFATSYEGLKKSEVQVSQGDTLASIAGRVLGNPSLWKLIWRHNDKIDNPDRLTAGTTLYYVDPQNVASLGKVSSEKKMADSSKKEITKKAASVGKSPTSSKKMVYETANDYLGKDLFSGNNGSYQQHLMI